ncbi:5932_t:CDS:2, partial [Funneliformis mosseae]
KNVKNCDDIQITENLNIVAIDPGIHTSWSWYSPSKEYGWFELLMLLLKREIQ